MKWRREGRGGIGDEDAIYGHRVPDRIAQDGAIFHCERGDGGLANIDRTLGGERVCKDISFGINEEFRAVPYRKAKKVGIRGG